MKLYTEAVLKLENWNKNDEFKLRRREDDVAEKVGPILWLVAQCVTACRAGEGALTEACCECVDRIIAVRWRCCVTTAGSTNWGTIVWRFVEI